MTTRNQHINNLKKSGDWIDYIKENSGLPGKRANLELLMIVAEMGNEAFFNSCLSFHDNIAPTNTQGEFVAMCGVTGLGKLVSKGKQEYFSLLREFASDKRWRVREGVAFALQIIGKKDFDQLILGIQEWIKGNNYEKRAVAAGLCEPALLKERIQALKVLEIMNEIIESVTCISERKSESFRVLKKGLAYGLSVAMVGCPEKGKEVFESLRGITDKEIDWILHENLKKKRLEKMDKDWTEKMKHAGT